MAHIQNIVLPNIRQLCVVAELSGWSAVRLLRSEQFQGRGLGPMRLRHCMGGMNTVRSASISR